jgi:hypothetical protein
MNRASLRAEAKKLYKEQTKGIPKKQRLPFAQFFKQYRAIKLGKVDDVTQADIDAEETDFDFDNIINVNEISDDDLEAPQVITRDEDQE